LKRVQDFDSVLNKMTIADSRGLWTKIIPSFEFSADLGRDEQVTLTTMSELGLAVITDATSKHKQSVEARRCLVSARVSNSACVARVGAATPARLSTLHTLPNDMTCTLHAACCMLCCIHTAPTLPTPAPLHCPSTPAARCH
jgi:hypothetical protein